MPPLRFWMSLLLVAVTLMQLWRSSDGYPSAFNRAKLDHSPKEFDDALWILMQGSQPNPRWTSSLEQVLHTRNGKEDYLQRNGPSSSLAANRSSSGISGSRSNRPLTKRFTNILHEAFRNDDNSGEETTFRSPQNKWSRTVGKRGIGLFSLAVALAQNNVPVSKPRMQPVDLSAYPRRARFFVASMG